MRFTKETVLEVPARFAFDWHTKPSVLSRLFPPWEKIKVISPSQGINNGDRTEFSIPLFAGLRSHWLAEYCGYEEGHKFEDVQLKGPFQSWHHKHIFEPVTETTCRLIDDIQYTAPLGKLGQFLNKPLVQKKLEAQFAYRHRQTKTELELHYQYRERKRLRILISGSSGIIGTSLCSFLRTGGHEVVRLVRDEELAKQDSQTIFWDPKRGEVDRNSLESFDSVIHLGGANLADRAWKPAYKQEIKKSRVQSTQLLAALLSTLQEKPASFIVASAIGYYGNRGDEILTEKSESGIGFLPEVVRAWEEAAEPARKAGIRVLHPRIGVVLTPTGAALGKMLTPFRYGLGGIAGNGKQFWSSVSIHDVVGAIHFLMMNETICDAVNVVLPQPVTNREFTKTLGNVLNRPTIFPMPAFLIKLLLREMGEALLLESTRVIPEKLLDAGYQFQQKTLEDTFRHLLGRAG